MQDAGGTTTYTYSTRNLLTGMTDPTGKFWQFAYNPDGLRTTTWFATPTATSTASWAAMITTSFDKADRITEIKAQEHSAAPSTVSDVSYCYSKYVSGQPCPVTSATTDRSLVQYSVNDLTSTVSQDTYDTGNRLKSETNVGGQTYSYGYDSNGNITSGTGIGSLGYNADNQITTSGYGYDGAGNQILNPANGTQGYNDAGQMISATAYQGPESFTYAGPTQDQMLSDGTATGITYGLAGQDGQSWVQSYYSVEASQIVYVLRDQQGTPLGIDLGGQYCSAFVTDNLGSVTAMINTSGATVASYTYGPYGSIITRTGTIDAENLTGYTGALTDLHIAITGIPSTSYADLGDRWYNPAAGSFTTQDPQTRLGIPANANAYAADNPANYTDPTGQDIWGCLGAVVGTVAAVGTLVAVSVGTAGTADVFAAGALIAGAATAVEQVGFFSAVGSVLGGAAGSAASC